MRETMVAAVMLVGVGCAAPSPPCGALSVVMDEHGGCSASVECGDEGRFDVACAAAEGQEGDVCTCSVTRSRTPPEPSQFMTADFCGTLMGDDAVQALDRACGWRIAMNQADAGQ